MRTSLIGITISFSLLALSAQAQVPSFIAAGVVNAASNAVGIAPGMRAVINGSNLGDPSFFRNCGAANPVPTVCFGTMVLVNGSPAPVLTTSANQIGFQVPFGITGSTATIQVTSNQSGSTLSSGTATVPLAASAPGLFTTNGTGSGTGYYVVAGGLLSQVSPPVQAGSTVVMFGTGFGATNPAVATGSLGPNTPAAVSAPVTMTINNQSVAATAQLEPGNLQGAALGYDEVIFTVPSGLSVPAGQATATFPVVVTVGGVASPPVNLIVAPAPPTITSVSPSPVPLSASPQVVAFNGSGFQSGLSLTVAGPSGQTTISGSNVNFVSATQFTVQLTTGTTGGTWSAIVVNPGGSQSDTFVFTASGTGPTTNATISQVVTTSTSLAQISQNTWIEIHGTNLANSTLLWNSLPSSAFLTNLPTSLGGVSVTINNIPAAVYYVSSTQLNVLAPLDTATGPVSVAVSSPNGNVSTTVTELSLSPAFLLIDGAGHVAAEHVPGFALIGPASLNAPGYTFTPAAPGSTIVLYAVGFGQTNPPITNQLTGLAPLPALPSVTIGGVPALVTYAGLSPSGLYQLNVTVPTGLPNGDAAVTAMYNGSSTQGNVLLTIGQ